MPTRCDPDRLAQVITNLLTNATKYSDGGEILVRVWREGNEARLSVRDQGPGIPAEQIEAVFEPYVRLSDDQSGRPRGSGLGLYIARGIVQAHAGRIWVTSTPGQGATLHVGLPLIETA